MKRLVLALMAALAVTALAAGTGAGAPDDAKGPPCANITDALATDYYNPAANPDLRWTFVLAGPSCGSVTYTLEIYSFDGTTLLDTVSQPGNGSTNLEFNYNFSGTAPSDGVCLVGKTIRKGDRLTDRAPDSDCLPVSVGDPGGQGGFG